MQSQMEPITGVASTSRRKKGQSDAKNKRAANQSEHSSSKKSALPPGDPLSPFGSAGGYTNLRGRLLEVAKILVNAVGDSQSGDSLSELEEAVLRFLRDASLGAGKAASTPSRSLGTPPGVRPSPLPTKGSGLTTAEKLARRQERKFQEMQARGLV